MKTKTTEELYQELYHRFFSKDKKDFDKLKNKQWVAKEDLDKAKNEFMKIIIDKLKKNDMIYCVTAYNECFKFEGEK